MRGEVGAEEIRKATRNWLEEHTDVLGVIGPFILEQPEWWPILKANCGSCGPNSPHAYDFVAIIPVAICMGANMDVTVALHQLWDGTWEIHFTWTAESPNLPSAIRLDKGDEAGYKAMRIMSHLWQELQKVLG